MNRLIPSWAGQPAWRILDTGLDATRLLAIWLAWQADPQRPRVLHLVALTPNPPGTAALQQAAATQPEHQALADELLPQWRGLLPGFHRIALAAGQFQLTLGVGELQPMLREQQFEADTVYLDTAAAWDRWSAKALTRCCRRGTALVCDNPAPPLLSLLRQSGFEPQDRWFSFQPPWDLKTSRESQRTQPATPGRCAVIGAGLAGASVAAALARRGWAVQVLDAAPAPAAGASGLPAGLVVPHVSADDSPRSRLSRAGLRLMLQEAQRLLERGADWDACGVLEHRLDGRPGLPPDWSAAGREVSRPAQASDGAAWRAGMADAPSLWHAQAGWIKPAQLVRAWLAQPGVSFLGGAEVASLSRQGDRWCLHDTAGRVLASASHVVLANACDAPRLLAGLAPDGAMLPATHGMRGLLSWGLRKAGDESALPAFPVNGMGSLIPAVPTEDGRAWYAGATYEAAERAPATPAVHHQTNLDKLRTLLPAAGLALGPAFEAGAVHAWRGTRCVSADRLPLVGPLEDGTRPTLWISAAMGSRGLSFSMLCAELLASRIGAEPWPLEASLARFLHARRRTAVQAPDL